MGPPEEELEGRGPSSWSNDSETQSRHTFLQHNHGFFSPHFPSTEHTDNLSTLQYGTMDNLFASTQFSIADSYTEDLDETEVGGFMPEQERRDEVEQVNKFTQKETSKVLLWRRIVLILFVVAAGVASVLTYFSLGHGDNEGDTEALFHNLVLSMHENANEHLRGVVAKTVGVSDMLTAHALSTQQEWPFGTLPNFDMIMELTGDRHTLAPSEFVGVAPLVTSVELSQWNNYTRNREWMKDTFVAPTIFRPHTGTGDPIPVNKTLMMPLSQTSPFRPDLVNLDLLSLFEFQELFDAMLVTKGLTLGSVSTHDIFGTNGFVKEEEKDLQDRMDRILQSDFLLTPMVYPVFEKLHDPTSKIVGLVASLLNWKRVFEHLVPPDIRGGFYAVLRDSCGNSYTYSLNGREATFVGEGDLHASEVDNYEFLVEYDQVLEQGDMLHWAGNCSSTLSFYPTSVEKSAHDSSIMLTVLSATAVVILVLTVIAFFVYDKKVEKKNEKIVNSAAKSNAIVSSMFPSNLHDRLFDTSDTDKKRKKDKKALLVEEELGKKNRMLKQFLDGDVQDDEVGEDDLFKTKPIADLYPETTIMFCDLVGFTAWSSVREPSQVFMLLETIYRAFDQIAKRRRVFKVETVGDCYVAAAGLPDPRKEHAVVMARFANDCLKKVLVLTKKLERTLGPDTGELSMRFGLHSGPVTAGVLRGERSRFQLFGDTMNTAARMESNGFRGRIQLSQETADLLAAAGKGHWLVPREDKIVAKGKGELQTFWLEVGASGSIVDSAYGSGDERQECSSDEAGTTDSDESEVSLDDTDIFADTNRRKLSPKHLRLVDWNVECLLRLLKQIVARREALGGSLKTRPGDIAIDRQPGGTVLDEVKECIEMPEFDENVERKKQDWESIKLDKRVGEQLRDYIATICSYYRNNSFHNFEHASHVTQSVLKLLSRIVPTIDTNKWGSTRKLLAFSLYDNTYGITSDPLTQFACVFSALVHDCDHPGVPNTQLIKEEPDMASQYRNKSVAEQHSVDLAWDLLMEDKYEDLRAVLCATQQEMEHFRQIVVNAVMATDIMEKDLKELRNERWNRAFKEISLDPTTNRENVNRKATIVIEHLIQASDIAHTMQHWHIYRKWNERLFKEMLKAYKEGRSDKDPTENWYQGELGFFDFYVIPLAQKLKDCGVFGVSSDEYLNYAKSNRKEWEERGREVLAEMKEKVTAELIAESLTQRGGVTFDPSDSESLFKGSFTEGSFGSQQKRPESMFKAFDSSFGESKNSDSLLFGTTTESSVTLTRESLLRLRQDNFYCSRKSSGPPMTKVPARATSC